MHRIADLWKSNDYRQRTRPAHDCSSNCPGGGFRDGVRSGEPPSAQEKQLVAEMVFPREPGRLPASLASRKTHPFPALRWVPAHPDIVYTAFQNTVPVNRSSRRNGGDTKGEVR